MNTCFQQKLKFFFRESHVYKVAKGSFFLYFRDTTFWSSTEHVQFSLEKGSGIYRQHSWPTVATRLHEEPFSWLYMRWFESPPTIKECSRARAVLSTWWYFWTFKVRGEVCLSWSRQVEALSCSQGTCRTSSGLGNCVCFPLTPLLHYLLLSLNFNPFASGN